MKSVSIPLVLLATAGLALANTAPTVVIQSATMRPGTTLMDVVYRVNDPDDATVKTRALAFVDGVRSFAKVIRPVTFVEGTAAKLGDAIPANVNHTLTWDVAADWDVDLGQVKFEVLAMDGRGLLPFDWITIPAAGGHPEVTLSKDSPANAAVLNALCWQYADGDPGITLADGVLRGNAASGNFVNIELATGSTLATYSAPFIFMRMNLATSEDVGYAVNRARAGIVNPAGWHAANHAYQGLDVLVGWGSNSHGQATPQVGVNGIVAVGGGAVHTVVLRSDGVVLAWGFNNYGQSSVPAGLTDATAISAGSNHNLALKSDGTVVAWGRNNQGQTSVSGGLAGVLAVSAGAEHSLALKDDGTVVGWGYNYQGQTTIPAGLDNVVAIAAGGYHSLALKSNGTVAGWGANDYGQITIPAGLSGVVAIAAGSSHSLALRSDGTVVAWGQNSHSQASIPAGLANVTAIATGSAHNLALKNDGTVIGWGYNFQGQATVPAGLSGVAAIGASNNGSFAVKAKAP